MPKPYSWKNILDFYSLRKREWIHPNADVLTFEKIPPYVKAETPLPLSANLPGGGIYVFGFDFVTPASESAMYGTLLTLNRGIFHYATENIHKMLTDHKRGAIAHAFVDGPYTGPAGYLGRKYVVFMLYVPPPGELATGLSLGEVGQLLSQFASEFVNQAKAWGYNAVVDLSNPEWGYIASMLELTTGVITSGQLFAPVPPGPTVPSQPTTPTQPTSPFSQLIQDPTVKWILIGLLVVFLLIFIAKR